MAQVKIKDTPNLGFDTETVKKSVRMLQTLLADEMLLYQKLRKFHWNVTGPQFKQLHELFEEQYTALAETIDVVAERVRAYGELAHGTFSEFLENTRLEEHPGENPDAHTMVSELLADHETLFRHLNEHIDRAGEINDMGLQDLFIAMVQMHQKMAWMLRSFIEGSGI
jgi:starvation-inducible DNA-binding protein